jgi:thiol-disulfide isomerase/thioredoxin
MSACVVLAFVAGGCGAGGSEPSEALVPAQDKEAFQAVVLDSHRPVLVFFYKDGCPSCAALEPTMQRLAAEYHGRAVVAKCSVMSLFFVGKNTELRAWYKIVLYPTVILFVEGRQRETWETNNHTAAEYRKALDAVVPGRPRKPA